MTWIKRKRPIWQKKPLSKMQKLLRRKSTAYLTKKLELVFNEFIRLRDRLKGCISCGGPVNHAGHFYPISVCPQAPMRFCEENVHGQCVTCNSFQEGNRHGYRKGLEKRYPGILERLEIKKSIPQKPWSAFDYEVMIKSYKAKIKTVTEKDLI